MNPEARDLLLGGAMGRTHDRTLALSPPRRPRERPLDAIGLEL
jgi:hypothetical protein